MSRIRLVHFTVCFTTVVAFADVATAALIVIDDFSAGPLNVTLNQANPSLDQTQTGLPSGSTAGGRRTIGASLNFPFLPADMAFFTVDTAAQTFRVDADAALEAYGLSYGLRSLSSGTADQALDLNLSAGDHFKIDVVSSLLAHTARFSLRSGTNEGNINSSFANVLMPASATPYSLIVPFTSFSSFGDPANFSDIDYISFGNGGASPGFDLVLDSIAANSAVPEPGSGVLLLALGLCVVIMRLSSQRQSDRAT